MRTPPRPAHAWIALAALIAVAPLILHGASCGHDFDFHILSWIEASQQILHGHFPQWAYTPAYNAGEPRFVFYPPISWVLGALLGLAMPWHWTPAAYTWIALTLSGTTMYRLARRYTGDSAALLASAAYLANPYMLFTAYERTAYAELLAAAWMPLLLEAALAEQISIPRIAVPITLLWLTNAPAGVMGCYALALIAIVRLVLSERTAQVHRVSHRGELNQFPHTSQILTHPTAAPHPFGLIERVWSRLRKQTTVLDLAGKYAAGTALGLTLPAFYLLPAAYEQRFVQVAMAVIPGMRIADNTLFHTTGDAPHDVVLHTASILSIILLGVTAAALTAAWLQTRRSVLMPLAILAALIALLLLPISLPLWTLAPELKFLQFPWRTLAILAAVAGLALAIALDRLRLGSVSLAFTTILIAWSMSAPAYRHFAQGCDTPDTVDARVALFHSPTGTDPTDEYTPVIADNDSLQPADPGYWISPTTSSNTRPYQGSPGQAPRTVTIDAPTPETLVLNRREYPSWRIKRNGTVVHERVTRADGLIAIPIPAGRSTIELTEIRPADRIVGDGISCIALLILLLRKRRRPFF